MTRAIFVTVLFIASMGGAFWLIHFDTMIRAFIGFAIIAGWFYVFLTMCFRQEEPREKDNSHDP